MKKIIGGALGVTFIAITALADGGAPAPSAKDLTKAVERVNYVESDTAGVKLSGYVDVGYIYNFIPGGAIAPTRGYDASDSGARGDFNVNAVKLTLERPLTEKNEWQAGFRVDAFLGKDWNYGTSGIYLQQALVEVLVPIGNGLNLQLGKIGSILGFEADERSANMNITQGFNATIDPGPAAGVLATYPVTGSVSALLGVNNNGGGDTNFGLDTSRDGYDFTAGVNYHNDNFETQLAGLFAPWGDETYGGDNITVSGVNWWASWAPKFAGDKLLLALNTSYYYTPNLSPLTVSTPGSFTTAALYAKYQFTDIFSLAGRGEWVAANEGDGTDNFWSLTLTAGFNIVENLLLRAEYRYDTGRYAVYNLGDGATHNSAHTLALEAVYSF